jgi:hypothetical protein
MRVEWDPAPPTTKQRILAGVLLAFLLLTFANDHFEWRLFAGYDKYVEFAALIIALVAFLRFMPRIRRV